MDQHGQHRCWCSNQLHSHWGEMASRWVTLEKSCLYLHGAKRFQIYDGKIDNWWMVRKLNTWIFLLNTNLCNIQSSGLPMFRFRSPSSQYHPLPKRHRHDNQRLPHGLFMGQLQIRHRMEIRPNVTQRSSSYTMSSGRCIQFHSTRRFPVPNSNFGWNHQRSSSWRLGTNWTVFV